MFLFAHVFMSVFVFGCSARVVSSIFLVFVADVDLHLCILGRICSRFDYC